MRRRQFIQALGTGLATFSLAPTVSARQDGELPNDHVNQTRVDGFAPKERARVVPAGNWITHVMGWIDTEGGDQSKADIERWLDAVDYTAWIDGEKVENSMDYWGTPVKRDGKWYVWWEYSTPPKKPGYHTFTTEWAFPDGFTDGEDIVREPGDRYRRTGYYKVEPERGRK